MPSAASGAVFSSSDPEPMLKCVLCNARIPLSDLSRHEPRTRCSYTAELLAGLLVTRHLEHCTGRRGGELLRADDAPISVAECGRFRKATESLSISDQEWLGSLKAREEWTTVFTSGQLVHTHPELFQRIAAKFPPLPVERLKFVRAEFWWPLEDRAHFSYQLRTEPRLSALYNFPLPRSQSAAQPVQVPYDRGTIVNPIDIEAREMADCKKRYESFNKSEILKGTEYAFQLAKLGFYFVGDRNAVGKLRCSFCKKTFEMFTQALAPHLDNNFERLLVNLRNLHSHISGSICPFNIGLNGDDKRFSANDMACGIEPFVRTGAIQLSSPNLAKTPNLDSSSIQNDLWELTSISPTGLPPIDGDDADKYSKLFAQHEEELFSEFDSDSDLIAINEPNPDDNFTLQRTPIDDLIGIAPKRPDMVRLVDRIDSFNQPEWQQQRLSQGNNPHLTPEKFAKAGFYYSGSADKMLCHWCRLELDFWQQNDKPWHRHVYAKPNCEWVFRNRGRYSIRPIYMSELHRLQLQQTVPNIFLTNTGVFLKGIESISGGLDEDSLTPTIYRIDNDNVPIERCDLPQNRPLIDEFGLSESLMVYSFRSQLVERGDDHSSAQQTLETILAYEDSMLERGVNESEFIEQADELRRQYSQRDPPAVRSARDLSSHVAQDPADAIAAAQRRPRSGLTEEATAPATIDFSETPAAPNGPPHPAEINLDGMCVVCVSNQREVAVLPCGHLCLCIECYPRLQLCPICRARIRGALRNC